MELDGFKVGKFVNEEFKYGKRIINIGYKRQ